MKTNLTTESDKDIAKDVQSYARDKEAKWKKERLFFIEYLKAKDDDVQPFIEVTKAISRHKSNNGSSSGSSLHKRPATSASKPCTSPKKQKKTIKTTPSHFATAAGGKQASKPCTLPKKTVKTTPSHFATVAEGKQIVRSTIYLDSTCKIGGEYIKSITTFKKPEDEVCKAPLPSLIVIDPCTLKHHFLFIQLSFLRYYFGPSRVLTFPTKIKKGVVINQTVNFNGYTWELVSRKMKDKDKGQNGHKNNKEADAEFDYIATSGPDMDTVNLQEELERICGFGSLGAKAPARLEHLQSHAKSIVDISTDYIEWIEEAGHEGCGFFPDKFFDGMKACPFKRSDAMQVRFTGSSVGLCKGILVKKPGIRKIQLPCSMRKALPSNKTTSHGEYASLVFKQLSSPSYENQILGRLLNPNDYTQGPPTENMMQTKQKVIGEMYHRILCGLGIPSNMLNNYIRDAKELANKRHATLMGATDPIKLPYGKVFITGRKSYLLLKVFPLHLGTYSQSFRCACFQRRARDIRQEPQIRQSVYI